jgi:lipopolysaccharide transport system permease protein
VVSICEPAGDDSDGAAGQTELVCLIRKQYNPEERRKMSAYVTELIEARELLFTWTMRDFKVRYSQSVLGAAWAILQPLSLIAVYSVIFSVFVQVPTGGIPYPVFAYVAILPWSFFANSLNSAIPSLVNNMNLVSKIYFPREILPLSAIMVSFIDFLIASSIFVLMLLFYRVAVGSVILLVPLVLLIQVILAFGISLLASAVNVRYRDVRFVIPLALQIWMYLSPIIYPVNLVPERFRPFYFLNPMAVLIDTYRRTILFNQMPDWPYLGLAALVSISLTIFAYHYFKRAEREFADLI